MSSISLNELKARRQWIVWKLEQVKGRGKPAKVPYSPITGRRTGCNEQYRPEWVTHAEAIECMQRSQGVYSGVGIVLTDGLCGIDIDDRLPTNSLTQDIMSKVSSYTEYSPSGTGLHILLTVDVNKLPNDFVDTYKEKFYTKNSALNVECYLPSVGGGGRYFTFTENMIADKPINDCTEGVLEFLDGYMKRRQHTSSSKPRISRGRQPVQKRLKAPYEPKQGQSDGDVMEAFSTYDNACTSFLAGRWKELNYPTQSEADLAFVQRLLYWSGGDIAQVDSIFRQSGLMRPKWDELRGSKTYGQMTIESAMQSNYPSSVIRKALRSSWLASMKKKMGGST